MMLKFTFSRMVSSLSPVACTDAVVSRKPTSSSDRVISWEHQITELLSGFPMSSTFEIVVALCPNFFEKTVSARTALWKEISSTLSRMLAHDLVSVEVDQVQLTHWSLDPSGAMNHPLSRSC
jgi:hypothetical protein